MFFQTCSTLSSRLSVPINKCVSNIDSLFWFRVCLYVRVSDAAGGWKRCGVCDIMYLSLKWYMVIIRLRLQSIPICFSHTGPHWPTIKFTTTRHPIPHLYWEWRILKAVVFSVKFWLINAALSLHFNCGVKRLHPERVIACSLLFLRNELIHSINFHCAQNAEDSGHFQTTPSDTYKHR